MLVPVIYTSLPASKSLSLNSPSFLFPSKELEEILGRTLGVPLFQEQAMKIAIAAASFTPAEADELRRAMATFKAKGVVSKFEKKLTDGMIRNGYTKEFAQRVFNQLKGFGSYGFPESHAASFALLVYVSSWIKCYYPDIFATALLNSLPMGFYQPAQIVYDARKHGVPVRPVDINYSNWDHHLEEMTNKYHSLRLGFRPVKGLRAEDMEILLTNRDQQFKTIAELHTAGVSIAALERLADADAFRSIGLDRRQALWEVRALEDMHKGMFAGQPSNSEFEQKVVLPHMAMSEQVVHDYGTTSLSLKAHPVSFARLQMDMLNITRAADLANLKNGAFVKVAGLVLVRQRPGTAAGVCFITIEDETGSANLVVFQKLFEQYRREVTRSTFLMVEGKVQIEGKVIHVIAHKCADFTGMLKQLSKDKSDPEKMQTFSRADERNDLYVANNKREGSAKPVQGNLFPGSRDFK